NAAAFRAVGRAKSRCAVLDVIELIRRSQLLADFVDCDDITIVPRIDIREEKAGIPLVRQNFADVRESKDCQVALQQVQSEATKKRGRSVWIAGSAEGRVHARINAVVEIERRVDMRVGENARVLQWQSEIEDVIVRVKEIAPGIDDLCAQRRHVL